MKSLLLFFMAAMAAFACGCQCVQDITNDSSLKFSAVKDRPFATRKVMLLYGGKDPATNLESYEMTVAGETPRGDMPTAILPIGTILCPVRATAEVCESGNATTYVQIETGDFAGKQASLWNLWPLFFMPEPYGEQKKPVSQWEANPEYLKPVGTPKNKTQTRD